MDGRQVQLWQFWLCSANHAICYYDIYHKSRPITRTQTSIKINVLQPLSLFMATLCNREGHIHVFSSCGFFFFLVWSQRSEIGRLPYFHTWCGLSVNLECRSETCCARLAENTARKKSPKSRHLGTIPHLCRAISSQLRYVSTIRKKTC